MNILALETASTICGVSLFLDKKMIDLDEINKPKIHGQRLPIIVKQILERNKVKLNDLDGIAISIGPGSYTGLRIGLSFSKGLATSGNLPLIPIPTLSAINYNINLEGEYSIMLHSHKEYVYLQDYSSGIAQNEVIFTDYKLKKNKLIFGFNLDHLNLDFNLAPPSSEAIAKIAIENFTKLKEDKIYKVIPNYITSI